jgi:hypothetical protein
MQRKKKTMVNSNFLIKVNQLNDAFTSTHPAYCHNCGGWGTIGGGIPDRDTGFDDGEPCPVCSENGICPWCGKETLSEDGTACNDFDCGFTYMAGGIIERDDYEMPDLPERDPELNDLALLDRDTGDPLGAFGDDFDLYHNVGEERNRRVARGY